LNVTTVRVSAIALVVAVGCARKPINQKGDSGTDGTVVDVSNDTTLDGQLEKPESGDGDGRDASSEQPIPPAGLIQGYDLVTTASNGVAVVGRLEGSVDLAGGSLLVSAGLGDLFLGTFTQAGSAVWTGNFGDAAAQGGGRIARDGAGNLFVAASFTGTIDVGGGPFASAGAGDVCVARFDPGGRHVWSQRFGNQFHQEAVGAAIDSTGRPIVAISSQGPFDVAGGPADGAVANSSSVAQLDATGGLVWSKSWTGVMISSIAVNNADEILVTGSFDATIDLGGGPLSSMGGSDIFVVVLRADGAHKWSKRFGGTGRSAGAGIAADTDRNIVLTGMFDDSFDLGGPTLVSVLDNTRFSPSSDVFVAKLDAAGNHVWSLRFGDAHDDQSGSTIATDAAGNVFLAGFLKGTVDFGLGPVSLANGASGAFIVKLAPTGATLWNLGIEGNAIRVRAAPSGGVLVAGAFPGTLPGSPVRSFQGGSNVFLVEYPP
jgi:hypothetical protein